jgi:hypothetical protein
MLFKRPHGRVFGFGDRDSSRADSSGIPTCRGEGMAVILIPAGENVKNLLKIR